MCRLPDKIALILRYPHGVCLSVGGGGEAIPPAQWCRSETLFWAGAGPWTSNPQTLSNLGCHLSQQQHFQSKQFVSFSSYISIFCLCEIFKKFWIKAKLNSHKRDAWQILESNISCIEWDDGGSGKKNQFLYCSPRLLTWKRDLNQSTFLVRWCQIQDIRRICVPGNRRCLCTLLWTCWWVCQPHGQTSCPPSSSGAESGPWRKNLTTGTSPQSLQN